MTIVKNGVEMLKAETAIRLNGKIRLVLLVILLTGVSFFLYAETLKELFSSVIHRKVSSHGIFVPFIAIYFVWLNRHKLNELKPEFALLPGGIMLAAGFFLFSISLRKPQMAISMISFFIVLGGLLMSIFGQAVFKVLLFPILFLITMIPLPKEQYNQIADWLRIVTTNGAVWLLQGFSIPLYRDGFSIHLPEIELVVDYSCSGIRYLLSYFVFSLAYTFLFKKSAKARIFTVLASFPICLIASTLRLSLIFLAAHYIGPVTVEKLPHHLISWSVFLVVMVVAVGADQSLTRLRERRVEN